MGRVAGGGGGGSGGGGEGEEMGKGSFVTWRANVCQNYYANKIIHKLKRIFVVVVVVVFRGLREEIRVETRKPQSSKKFVCVFGGLGLEGRGDGREG